MKSFASAKKFAKDKSVKGKSARYLLSCLLLAVGACGDDSSSTEADAAADIDATVYDAGTPDAQLPIACETPKPLPVSYETLTGFSGSEDFAFDDQGNLVSNADGSMTKQPKEGDRVLFSPNLGETSGVRFLSNGVMVVASGENTLIRIETNGANAPVASGFDYPNGVEVDQEDFVYVAEQNAGNVRRVNPVSGESTIVASGLFNPNGVSFSPDYQTLYVNSFGGGTVHKIERDGDNWKAPVLIGSVLTGSCEGASEGDDCEGGSCQLVNGQLQCVASEGCENAGDLCRLQFEGGLCVEEQNGLRCSSTGNGPERITQACQSLQAGQSCNVIAGSHSVPGTCQDFGKPALECTATNPCNQSNVGQACISSEYFYGVYEGTCVSEFGEYRCSGGLGGGKGGGETGGLDGMAVDACGNIYVTEYVAGKIWRFTPEGQRDLVIDLPSGWIPNMHWGTGEGGWDIRHLYVMDRDQGRVFDLDMGVQEKVRVFP